VVIAEFVLSRAAVDDAVALGRRYSDAIRIPAGQDYDQIIIFGTPGLDENGAIPADFADEARQAWRNIGAILAHAGASVNDIISVRQYLTRAKAQNRRTVVLPPDPQPGSHSQERGRCRGPGIRLGRRPG